MLALILRAAGWHPSFLIGGDLNEVGTNAVFDSGEWLVVEADESDGTFLELAPHDAVVTTVLPDHLDHYGDFPALVDGVRAPSSARIPGVCALCADDDVAAAIAARAAPALVTYGFADGADYRMDGYEGGRSGTQFALARAGEPLGVVELPGARPAQRGERGGRRRDRRSSSGCPSTRSRARSAASAAWPVASSSAASATASPTSTTTRTSRATSTP